MATLEDETQELESIEFAPSYDNAVKINSNIYNRTPAGSKSVRLSGANANEMVALGKALKVVPGDTVYIEVYAKYTQPTTTNSQVGSLFLGALTGLFAPGVGAGLDGSGLQDVFELLGTEGLLFNAGDGVTESLPKAYLNYILFDDNYIPINFGFEQVTAAGLETGRNVPHEKLALRADVNQSGYLYIYLSNENDKIVDVFFDDLKITHHHSPIVQAADYYPFGLTFNSYQRTNSAEQRIKFQGQEHQELTGWVQFKWRNHDPTIGRFFNVDPLSEKYVYNSPYAFSENHVTTHIELEGLEKVFFQKALFKQENFQKAYSAQRQTSLGKSFRSKLKSQNEFNVLYFSFKSWSDGMSKEIESIDQFRELKKGYSNFFKELDDKIVEKALGGKKLILIGLNDYDLDNVEKSAMTLNHEEFHGERTLDGVSDENHDKMDKDHEEYYGEGGRYTPDDNEVLTNVKYEGTKAREQFEQILRILRNE